MNPDNEQQTNPVAQTDDLAAVVYYETPGQLLQAAEKAIKKTEVVLDIGCGIRPMNYFRPKLHVMVEPWQEYSDILAYRHADDKSVIILRSGALNALRQLAGNAVDSIFLLDVIEHLDKNEGRLVLQESERVAREQIVLFTPLGFMPQHLENDGSDGWGLSGLTVQEHRSGWDRKDFSKLWTLYICEEFHAVDHKGRPLEQKNGAFFAIRNFDRKTIPVPEVMPDIRLQLPSEREMLRLQEEIQVERNQYQALNDRCTGIESEYQTLLNSRSMRVVRAFKRVLRKMGISRFG